jgi:uncharacterized protein (DUF1778 family)
MKKRLNLTIDDDVYDMIERSPRTVSVSEVVSYVLRAFFQSAKGKVLNDNELQEWIDSDPKLQDFQQRLIEHWGPTVYKIEDTVKGIKKKVISERKKK